MDKRDGAKVGQKEIVMGGKITKLSALIPDTRNANKGTARGQKQIVGSIQRNGFGRSGLLDKNGQIVAGNKTTDAAAEVFGVEVEPIIIQTDGKRPVYVQRVDLDLDDPDPNNPARRLAYEDNLAQIFSFQIDPEIVELDLENGFDFSGIDVGAGELAELIELSHLAEEITTGLSTKPGSTDRALGDPQKQIKVILYVDEVGTFEKAIKATGNKNRGQALVQICEAYLSDAARQLDLQA